MGFSFNIQKKNPKTSLLTIGPWCLHSGKAPVEFIQCMWKALYQVESILHKCDSTSKKKQNAPVQVFLLFFF